MNKIPNFDSFVCFKVSALRRVKLYRSQLRSQRTTCNIIRLELSSVDVDGGIFLTIYKLIVNAVIRFKIVIQLTFLEITVLWHLFDIEELLRSIVYSKSNI
jgi:hypothetical protein